MGATSVGATVYWEVPESARQLQEVATALKWRTNWAHDNGTWCYVRNNGFKVDGVDYSTAADFTGCTTTRVTIQADIIKQNYLPITEAITPPNMAKPVNWFTIN